MSKKLIKPKDTGGIVWVDEYGHAKITLDLDGFFKLFSGKKISVEIEDE